MTTREAQFYLTKKESSSDGLVEHFHILLEDADGVDVNYIVTDYYNSSRTDIVETIISNKDTEEIINDNSYVGKRILEFVVDGGVSYDEAHPTAEDIYNENNPPSDEYRKGLRGDYILDN